MEDDNQAQQFISELSENGRIIVPADVANAVAEAVLADPKRFAVVAINHYQNYIFYDQRKYKVNSHTECLEVVK